VGPAAVHVLAEVAAGGDIVGEAVLDEVGDEGVTLCSSFDH
jgi:hypothetical protein